MRRKSKKLNRKFPSLVDQKLIKKIGRGNNRIRKELHAINRRKNVK